MPPKTKKTSTDKLAGIKTGKKTDCLDCVIGGVFLAAFAGLAIWGIVKLCSQADPEAYECYKNRESSTIAFVEEARFGTVKYTTLEGYWNGVQKGEYERSFDEFKERYKKADDCLGFRNLELRKENTDLLNSNDLLRADNDALRSGLKKLKACK